MRTKRVFGCFSTCGCNASQCMCFVSLACVRLASLMKGHTTTTLYVETTKWHIMQRWLWLCPPKCSQMVPHRRSLPLLYKVTFETGTTKIVLLQSFFLLKMLKPIQSIHQRAVYCSLLDFIIKFLLNSFVPDENISINLWYKFRKHKRHTRNVSMYYFNGLEKIFQVWQ